MLRLFIFYFILLLNFNEVFSGGVGRSSDSLKSQHGNYKDDKYYRFVNLTSKGWQLLLKWDFYNFPEDWNISSASRKSTGGYLQIENGIMEFGYSTLGAIVYKKNEVSIIPGYTYMILAKMKVNNPYRAYLGFYNPPEKKLHYYEYVKNTDWEVVSCLYSYATYASMPPIKNLNPAIQVITRQDNVYVDWVELWAYPDVSE